MLKNTQTSIKLFIWTTIVVTLVIGSSFVAGTFYPNWLALEKLEDEIHKQELKVVESLGLKEPEFEFSDKTTFINATSQCVSYLNWTTERSQRVPISIIIAMAGIESAWGTSRFAKEGNALFGVRTWDLDNVPHMKAKGNPDASWGVKKYQTKCQSVKDMIRILNTHPAYEGFRDTRAKNLETGNWNYKELMNGMTAWSTNPDYTKIIIQAIVDNKLP